jgi:hypothetical protein
MLVVLASSKSSKSIGPAWLLPPKELPEIVTLCPCKIVPNTPPIEGVPGVPPDACVVPPPDVVVVSSVVELPLEVEAVSALPDVESVSVEVVEVVPLDVEVVSLDVVGAA